MNLCNLPFFSFTNKDEHDFMHGESLGDFLILFEPWTVVNSVDTGVAVAVAIYLQNISQHWNSPCESN